MQDRSEKDVAMMIKRMIPVVLMGLLVGCTGGGDPEPAISGVYTITQYVTPSVGSATSITYNFPYTNPQNNQVYTGVVSVGSRPGGKLMMAYGFGIQGYLPRTDSLLLSVRSAGGQRYDMYDGANKVGTLDNTTLSYDSQTLINSQLYDVRIRAKK
ncbi:hypothetical protein GCM10027578_31360 [Spirosoma luteolum]